MSNTQQENLNPSSSNNPIPTLADLMDNANAQWRVFDMGRKIQAIGKKDFAAVEANTKPYPYPIQQKARMALLFWDQSQASAEGIQNPFIWFLQFDVDELGMLKLQQRDHYISMVIKELGGAMGGAQTDTAAGASDKLNNHPYSFTPDQNRRAAFNARVKVALKQPASMYYEHAQAYFLGQLHADKWQELTVQGIADFASRIDDKSNQAGLINALDDLSVQTLSVLGATLEHVSIGTELTQKLISQQQISIENQDHEQVFHLMRCMASSQATGLVSDQLHVLLDNPELSEESLFLIIAGRFWSYLNEQSLLHKFFDRIAQHPNQQLFPGIFADLVAVPETRQTMLNFLRDPNRSEACSRAIGLLFGR